jgi:hypothetical protein
MQYTLVSITMLTLCNFLVFLALIAIVLRARNRHGGSSFKQVSGNKYEKSDMADKLKSEFPVSAKDTVAVCCGKCQANGADSCARLHDTEKVMQKIELLPID